MARGWKYRVEVPLHDWSGQEAKYVVEAEALIPTTKYEAGIARRLELGLPGADSIKDRRIQTFSRGELPQVAGINTFTKTPYVEDVRKGGEYGVAILGVPFDRPISKRHSTRSAKGSAMCMQAACFPSCWAATIR